ncbi:MAG: hypothetical protein AVDCRST_MAG19-923, partial [uncultured Thermomicrobiales bacterium]
AVDPSPFDAASPNPGRRPLERHTRPGRCGRTVPLPTGSDAGCERHIGPL